MRLQASKINPQVVGNQMEKYRENQIEEVGITWELPVPKTKPPSCDYVCVVCICLYMYTYITTYMHVHHLCIHIYIYVYINRLYVGGLIIGGGGFLCGGRGLVIWEFKLSVPHTILDYQTWDFPNNQVPFGDLEQNYVWEQKGSTIYGTPNLCRILSWSELRNITSTASYDI